jgi:hypothetical protein
VDVIAGSKIGIESMLGCALLPERSGSIAVDLVAEGMENVEWVMRDIGAMSHGAALNVWVRVSEETTAGAGTGSTGRGGNDECSDVSEAAGGSCWSVDVGTGRPCWVRRFSSALSRSRRSEGGSRVLLNVRLAPVEGEADAD